MDTRGSWAQNSRWSICEAEEKAVWCSLSNQDFNSLFLLGKDNKWNAEGYANVDGQDLTGSNR